MFGADRRTGSWAHSVWRATAKYESLENNGNDFVFVCLCNLDIKCSVCVCVFAGGCREGKSSLFITDALWSDRAGLPLSVKQILH